MMCQAVCDHVVTVTSSKCCQWWLVGAHGQGHMLILCAALFKSVSSQKGWTAAQHLGGCMERAEGCTSTGK